MQQTTPPFENELYGGFQKRETDIVIALAGNPNVGKSTVFNALTGMHQHTGNWPGKTVSSAYGYLETPCHRYVLVDTPGTYSLAAHSAEETVARDFICFGDPHMVLVVCDATCLERNLNLVLQICEVHNRVAVCVNMMDEARRKHVHVDLPLLSQLLQVPVFGISAHNKKDLKNLPTQLDQLVDNPSPTPLTITYPDAIEGALQKATDIFPQDIPLKKRRFMALKLLESADEWQSACVQYGGITLSDTVIEQLDTMRATLSCTDDWKDGIVQTLMDTAHSICEQAVRNTIPPAQQRDIRIDRVLTGRRLGYPLMILLALLVFWLTIVGANYPSALLSDLLFGVQDVLTDIFEALHAPDWLHGALVLGVYRVSAWVVSVMLPPMMIFFPLFTILEDIGYLPRIAYNMDNTFQKCRACGKQALTMCMGFGCNAAAVVGCRIIDSPRERLLAILTNSFVPCNGRFPALIAIISMFFIGNQLGLLSSVSSALFLTLLIVLGIIATFGVTRLLSVTLLKGVPSSFTLELPPYRLPQFGKVIWRSIWDRTIFVLGRAVSVAAPAGLLLWLTANIHIGDSNLLQIGASVLQPFAEYMGLDGYILIAFILGLPANEIVLPIIIMGYTAGGTITDIGNLLSLKTLLVDNGWTMLTAWNVMLFSLFHWPCSTTLMTIHKETGSKKYTALAALLPTTLGVLLCVISTCIYQLLT